MTARGLLACIALTAVAACDSRYAVNDEGKLATRLTQDFPMGTPAGALVTALQGADFRLRGPVRTDPGALQDCLTRRATAALRLAGAKLFHVCFAADEGGRLIAIEVSTTQAAI